MNKDQVVAHERAREALYRREVKEKHDRPVDFARPRNLEWHRRGLREAAPAPFGLFAGRVALRGEHEHVPHGEFYIGTAHLDHPDYTVFSWAAPVAATFFHSHGHHLCDHVVGKRTFDHDDRQQISDYEDSRHADDAPWPLFQARGLAVPKAPGSQMPGAGRMPVFPAGRASDTPEPEPAGGESERPTRQRPRRRDLRGGEILRKRLQRPRTDGLAPVLATLQPEQYNLASWTAGEHLIVEGHPGTGKTVIAVHRAAYLTSPEYNADAADGAKVDKLLIVGPTDEYVDHVTGAISHLTGGSASVTAFSLRRIIAIAAGLLEVPEGKAITRPEDGSYDLWFLAERAVDVLRLRKGLVPKRSTLIKAAYSLLRANGEQGQVITTDPHWREYLASLPPYEKARTMRNHAPLIACLGLHVGRPDELPTFDHVVVDEAQDVMAVEWAMIDALNPAEHWTLLGDMHQRRSDAALPSWQDVAEKLSILDASGRAPVVTISNGYRSTATIMEYANRLLRHADRELESIQTDGPPVGVVTSSESALHENAVAQASDLSRTYRDGTVAIIGVEGPATEVVLRQRNWTKDPHLRYRWHLDGRTLDLVHPDHARGLEWDAVVVVEPSRFPENFRRHGLLYTSLTRANRELRIVHARKLPAALGDSST
ncbi:AAA family ATPase [Demequina pelophila]|uniref:AAA family ATPase n=1 Tax=Demequina pelophila TaxID=1638984 RepID=UPI0007865294|nr:AAA family ATPase [Demequina pelophila]